MAQTQPCTWQELEARMRPMLLADEAVGDWPAFKLWVSNDHLCRLAGSAPVEAMLGEDGAFCGSIDELRLLLTTLEQFLQNGEQRSPGASPPLALYLAQSPILQQVPGVGNQETPLKPLLTDILRPPCLAGVALHSINFWASTNFTRSSLHYDPYCNVLVVVRGRKQVRLAPPSAGFTLRARPLWSDAANHADGRIGTEDAHAQAFSLDAGQALFIPEGWWHSVESVADTIAINFWWQSAASTALERGEEMLSYYHRRTTQLLVERRKEQMVVEAVREAARFSNSGGEHSSVADLLKRKNTAEAARRMLFLTSTQCTTAFKDWMAEIISAADVNRGQPLLSLLTEGKESEIVLEAFLGALEAEKNRDLVSNEVEAACDTLYSLLPVPRTELLSRFLAQRQALAQRALLDVVRENCFGLHQP